MTGKLNTTVAYIHAMGQVDAFRKVGQARRKAEARKAKGVTRLTTAQRQERYIQQNDGRPLTARQVSRLLKKAHRG